MPTVPSTPFAWNELVLDRFTGNANATLAAHVPDFGSAWINNGGAICKLDGAGGVWSDDTGGSGDPIPQALTAAAASADQFAQCQVHQLDVNGGSCFAGLVARWTDDSNAYGLLYRSDSEVVQLLKLVAGAGSSLHDEPFSLTDGANLGLGLFLVGTRLTAVVGGTIVAVITDASLAAAGKLGFVTNADYASGISHGIHVHGFLAGVRP